MGILRNRGDRGDRTVEEGQDENKDCPSCWFIRELARIRDDPESSPEDVAYAEGAFEDLWAWAAQSKEEEAPAPGRSTLLGRRRAASDPDASPEALAVLARDMHYSVRALVVANPSCPNDIVEALQHDDRTEVSAAARSRVATTVPAVGSAAASQD